MIFASFSVYEMPRPLEKVGSKGSQKFSIAHPSPIGTYWTSSEHIQKKTKQQNKTKHLDT